MYALYIPSLWYKTNLIDLAILLVRNSHDGGVHDVVRAQKSRLENGGGYLVHPVNQQMDG